MINPGNLKSMTAWMVGLAVGTAGFHAYPAELFRENCETVEPAWVATAENGGTVEADDSLKHGGKRSIKLGWMPGPAIAPDGTASSQSKPENACAVCQTRRGVLVSDAAQYNLSYWIRTEGDIGWKSPQEHAVLKVELRYTVKDEDGRESTVTHWMIDADPHPSWTRITEFKTHPASGYMPGKVLTELTPPPGAGKLQLRFILSLNNRTATLWIDDIVLSRVDDKSPN